MIHFAHCVAFHTAARKEEMLRGAGGVGFVIRFVISSVQVFANQALPDLSSPSQALQLC